MTLPEASPQETIVAISTPPGRGGIGVVRLSGPAARQIAAPILRLRHPLAPGRIRFAEILDEQGNVLDQAVVSLFAAPHSYTSEDVVEIAAHGSPVVLEMLVRRAIVAGARLAEPGEFTQRAFLSGRIDLTQAEAVRDLIEASTLNQARVAARQLGGGLSHQVAPVKQQLIALIAGLEAGVDFAEDDIDTMPTTEIATRIAAVQSPLRELERSFDYGRIVHDGLRLAIVGRPNAGKSSLFNRLVERDRAIVTATAGTTRDLVTERVSVHGIPVELIDTAGLRDATDEAETIGIAKSREAMAEADLVLLVIDASADAHPEDAATLASLEGRTTLIAANKIDLADHSQHDNTRRTIKTSAITGEGIAELRHAILEAAGAGASEQETPLVTNLRQRQVITASLAALDRAATAASSNLPHEMLLIDLYDALQSLDALTGATTTDDILHLIFSSFCIGK